MFNFGDPPANLRNVRSRISFSDTGLNRNQRGRVPTLLLDDETSPTAANAQPVTLPPIIKGSKSTPQVQATKSYSSHGQPLSTQKLLPHHHIPQPHYVPQYPLVAQPEGRKLPSHREMIYLTLKHVQSARGLTFDQIYSFISAAFEIPRSFTLESKLRKTLSNMASKGVVIQNPGLEPRYVTYQLRQVEPEANLDLSVNGKSVPNVPSWPTSFSLPNGCDLLCRTGSIRKETPKLLPQQRHQSYRRNPMSMKLHPMTIGDPMICQSFGARAGLKFKNEQRPNSPNNCDDDDYDEQDDTDADALNFSERMWLSGNGNGATGHANRNSINKSPPRVLNTYIPPEDSVRDQGSQPCNDEQEVHEGSEEVSDDCKTTQTISSQTTTQTASVPPQRMFTAVKYTHQEDESYTTRTSGSSKTHKGNKKEEEPLSNFDIFANYNGETYKEYEMNNRSCHIMNDLSRSRALMMAADEDERETEMMSPKLNGADRMDYLLGIADIIDSYGEEPPEPIKPSSNKRSRPTKTTKGTPQRRF